MMRAFVTLLFFVVMLTAPAAFAGLAGSKHDLTRDTKKVYTHESGAVCAFCHVPHGGAGTAQRPLWAKRQKTRVKDRHYSLYAWRAVSGKNAENRPGAGSLNCLSCHDGTIGRTMSYNNRAQVTTYTMSVAGPLPGPYDPSVGPRQETGIFADHPVNIPYRAGHAGLASLKKVKGEAIPFSGRDGDQVECASCHNPHTSGNDFLLEKPEVKLCGACHAGRSTGKHVLAGFGFGGSHPIGKKADPLRKGRKLSCTTCHNPHASDVAPQHGDDTLTIDSLCLKCHEKIMVRDPGR